MQNSNSNDLYGQRFKYNLIKVGHYIQEFERFIKNEDTRY